MYERFDKDTASTLDRTAFALCQIIDDDAPMGWTRYRGVAQGIAHNKDLMRDLEMLAQPEAEQAMQERTERELRRLFRGCDVRADAGRVDGFVQGGHEAQRGVQRRSQSVRCNAGLARREDEDAN